MHIHILGIAGTFMGSLALIAKAMGHKVSGMDNHIYPPMSTQISEQNIDYIKGYNPDDLPNADIFIIGNALSRGNKCVEKILNQQYRYTSGAQWIAEQVLQKKWVLAVAGTHGKTTTTSMLAWILEYANLNPSFLIGGVPQNFNLSARLTDSPFFVIEADEYDTAFFDKRSKFVHYHPKTLVINNLELDHIDVFDSLAQVQKQFHHLLRTVPDNGLVICPENQPNIQQALAMGVWAKTQIITLPTLKTSASGTQFTVDADNQIAWDLLGCHNMQNALCAIYSAHHIGVSIKTACAALAQFKGVKRRLEVKYQSQNITLYDDFAHHPSAIKTTLKGLRAKVGDEPIIVILQMRSYTMKMGAHQQTLVDSLRIADQVLLLRPNDITWDIDALFADSHKIILFDSVDEIVNHLLTKNSGHWLVMSNGDFDGIHNRLINTLRPVV